MEADNFAQYLKGSTLSSLPEALLRRSWPGGGTFLDGAPDAADKAFLKKGFEQHVADASRGCLFLDIFVRIAGNQNDRGIEMPVPQAVRQVDAGHGRHLVVDNKAVGVAGHAAVEQGSGAAERPTSKPSVSSRNRSDPSTSVSSSTT